MSQALNGGSATTDSTEFDWQIVQAVADAKGIEPMDLEERLYDVVDPDAVYSLFSGRSGHEGPSKGEVSFTLARCEVTVDHDLSIHVRPLGDAVAAD